MIWLNLISASLGCCCDVLFVTARILAFSDRIGRWLMKVVCFGWWLVRGLRWCG